jgi:hypothetical protein
VPESGHGVVERAGPAHQRADLALGEQLSVGVDDVARQVAEDLPALFVAAEHARDGGKPVRQVIQQRVDGRGPRACMPPNGITNPHGAAHIAARQLDLLAVAGWGLAHAAPCAARCRAASCRSVPIAIST